MLCLTKSLAKRVAILTGIALMTVGCQATTQSSLLKKLPEYKVEKLEPPIEQREAKTLPAKTGKPTALAKCDDNYCKVPFTGILLDSYLLSKYKLIKAERDKLREWIMVERYARKDVQHLQNEVLADALVRAKRSWWEHNKGWVGLTMGVVAASALAIGLTAGLDFAQSN